MSDGGDLGYYPGGRQVASDNFALGSMCTVFISSI